MLALALVFGTFAVGLAADAMFDRSEDEEGAGAQPDQDVPEDRADPVAEDISVDVRDSPFASTAPAELGDGGGIHAGSDDADILVGGDGEDQVDGRGGDDAIWGGGGGDRLRGDAGDDRLDGGDGDDLLTGWDGDDTLLGGGGDDRLSGHSGRDSLDGGEGDDRLEGGQGDDDLDGGPGEDALHGNDGDDVLVGGEGSDTLHGGDGEDLLDGITGEDGGAAPDQLNAGPGDDTIRMGSEDEGYGDRGADIFVGGTWLAEGEAASILDFDPAEDVIVFEIPEAEADPDRIAIVTGPDGQCSITLDGSPVILLGDATPPSLDEIVVIGS